MKKLYNNGNLFVVGALYFLKIAFARHHLQDGSQRQKLLFYQIESGNEYGEKSCEKATFCPDVLGFMFISCGYFFVDFSGSSKTKRWISGRPGDENG